MDWSELGITVLSYIMPVLAAAIGSLIVWGLGKLCKKWGIEVDLRKDAQIRVAVRAAIKGAEEWGARKLKLDESKAYIGAEKALWVSRRVQATFPALLPDELEALIDEELASMWGVGALDTVVAGSAPDLPSDPISSVNQQHHTPRGVRKRLIAEEGAGDSE